MLGVSEGGNVLAYVFWHWMEQGVDSKTYVNFLKQFHQSLRDQRPYGLLEVEAFQVQELPWLGASSGFEDWYLVNGSADLDVLNDAAISQMHQATHDQVARFARGGTAGLYLLRKGTAHFDSARYAAWFHKPAGFSYEQLYTLIRPLIEQSNGALWGRQMTLGPTPEFCFHSTQDFELPSPLSGIKRELIRI